MRVQEKSGKKTPLSPTSVRQATETEMAEAGSPGGDARRRAAEALRRHSLFRVSYMSRAALFQRVMRVTNEAKLEDLSLIHI